MGKNAKIRGVLFDKDGTLFDFHRTWSDVIETTLAALARTPDERREMSATVGYDAEARSFAAGSPIVAGAIAEVAELWSTIRHDLTAARIEDVANRITAQAVEGGALCPAVPDLPAFLADLEREGFILGVATHDSAEGAHQQLAAVSALDHFSFIAGYDSGHGLKPSPGMLRAFAATASLEPGEIAVVGDSPGDLMMARNGAAAMAVGVLTGPAVHAELAPFADHVIPSIQDLPRLLRG